MLISAISSELVALLGHSNSYVILLGPFLPHALNRRKLPTGIQNRAICLEPGRWYILRRRYDNFSCIHTNESYVNVTCVCRFHDTTGQHGNSTKMPPNLLRGGGIERLRLL